MCVHACVREGAYAIMFCAEGQSCQRGRNVAAVSQLQTKLQCVLKPQVCSINAW